jgi:hypothetical protein
MSQKGMEGGNVTAFHPFLAFLQANLNIVQRCFRKIEVTIDNPKNRCKILARKCQPA